MMKTSPKKQSAFPFAQFLFVFIIPLIILVRFSDESSLGPAKSLMLALAFPVVFEIYNYFKNKKPSYLSLIAIGGILVTGAISLLGLSEDWLAFRRAAPYLAVSVALLVSVVINRSLLKLLLPVLLDMDKVVHEIAKKKNEQKLEQTLKRCAYILAGILMAIAAISYVLTKIIIKSQTDTVGFNHEYAQLRLWSLPAITLPLLIGITGAIYYLVTSIEKLSGLGFEDILKKK